ncbi:NADPH:adrenodoxin oxidoreductase like [Actinidia chinensis var. chinensis]|nr:NADPH:adrenodoxin oxidoreductase like [Actinidia chinensis var. chinensis]
MSGPSHCYTGQRELHFVFFRNPDRFLDSDDRSGHVAGVRFEKTILKESAGSGKQVAVGTGQFEDFESRLVLKSIGYKSVPVDGLPFDANKGIVPNIGGRVLINSSGDHSQIEGVYVCGWLKRGPTGIIATNLYCAEETIASISEDLETVLAYATSLPKPGREGLLRLLESRNVKVIPFNAWEKIDIEEKRLGSLKNKPRDKLTTWGELLKVAL